MSVAFLSVLAIAALLAAANGADDAGRPVAAVARNEREPGPGIRSERR